MATYTASFMIRNASRRAYELLREFMILPKVDHVGKVFKDEVDAFEKNLTERDKASALLKRYRSQFKENDFIEQAGIIPCVLATDAMAIEPYMEKSERMSYFFVYSLLPLSHSIPPVVLSVLPGVNGKGNPRTNAHLVFLKEQCEAENFQVVAISADGDTAYNAFLREFYVPFRGEYNIERSFEEAMALVPEIPIPIVTDFLHFAKCLRKRIANHPLSFFVTCPAVRASDLGGILGEDYLKPTPVNAQLKDSIALNLFTLRNVSKLYANGKFHAGMYFLPIVLWRLAIQALNITREMRVQLLKAAFEIVRETNRAANLRENTLPEKAAKGSNQTVLFYRKDDVMKFLSSLAVLGYILRNADAIEDLALNRIGTANLEHLFGVTRLGTRGNNAASEILHRLATSGISMEMAEKNGVSMEAKSRVRNTPGAVAHSADPDLISVEIPDEFWQSVSNLAWKEATHCQRNCSTVESTGSCQIVPNAVCFPSLVIQRLLNQVKDAQTDSPGTLLGGSATVNKYIVVGSSARNSKAPGPRNCASNGLPR
jgi:hypothetical protein